METYTFEAILKRPEGVGTWTYLDIPFDLSAAFCVKGQVKVKGTINGYPFRSSAIPHGNGTHYMVVNKSIRAAIGVTHGDIVQVVLEEDLEARIIVIPEDLAKALEANINAKTIFEALSYSHQKQYVEWIESTKLATTRQNRITKAIEMLPKGWNPKRKTSSN